MPTPNFPPFLILGKVIVVTAGTPVGLLDTLVYPYVGGAAGGLKAAVNGQKIRVTSILFVVTPGGNTGNLYIGVKGMNKATLAGVLFIIPAAAAGAVNWFTLPAQGFGAGNEITPEDIYIDGDTNGNFALVTCTMY
jgi:hypothetical protein